MLRGMVTEASRGKPVFTGLFLVGAARRAARRSCPLRPTGLLRGAVELLSRVERPRSRRGGDVAKATSDALEWRRVCGFDWS